MRPGGRRWSSASRRRPGNSASTRRRCSRSRAAAGAASGPHRSPSEDVAAAAKMPPDEQMAMIRGMVEKLQARMDADGGDVEGWLRLAQSRMVLGEPGRAEATFRKALELHPDEPALLKGYAELLVGPRRATPSCPGSTIRQTSC